MIGDFKLKTYVMIYKDLKYFIVFALFVSLQVYYLKSLIVTQHFNKLKPCYCVKLYISVKNNEQVKSNKENNQNIDSNQV